MKRIEAKTQLTKTFEALRLKKLPSGLVDHLTDKILTGQDPEGVVAELASVARCPTGRPARQVRKLVRLTVSEGYPRTTGVAESTEHEKEVTTV